MTDFADFLRWEYTSRDTIDFKKIYVDIAGDLNAGVMLSEIVYWYLPSKNGQSKLRVSHDGIDWIACARHEWWDRTRLSPKEADHALNLLAKKGIVGKHLYRFNGSPTVHIRLLQDAFLQAWNEQIAHPLENPFLPNGKIQIAQKSKSKSTKRLKHITETTASTTSETTKEKEVPLVNDVPAMPEDPAEAKQLAEALFKKAVEKMNGNSKTRPYTDEEIQDQIRRIEERLISKEKNGVRETTSS